MDHVSNDELQEQAAKLIFEIINLEAEKHLLEVQIHDKKRDLSRINELLDIRGVLCDA